MTSPPGLPQTEDPFDIVARAVPRHVWLSLAIVIVVVLAGLLVFEPKRPAVEAAAGGEAQTLEARVVEVLGEEPPQGPERPGIVQTVRVELTSGPQRGKAIEIRYGEGEVVGEESRLSRGDRVLVEYTEDGAEGRYYISDFVRWPVLLVLTLLFALVVAVVGGLVGVRALVSMGFSILILAAFVVRGILAGYDPLWVALAGSLAILAASVYLTYGWQAKTHAAMLGLAAGLVVTAILATLFVGWLRLSGLGSESALFLRFSEGWSLDLRGVLLAGIIIGALGVLDDVTTNQAAVVFELKRAAPSLTRLELFRRSMVVGRDHIAAVVNTLLLAYAGASLTLLLLMAVQNASLAQTLNRNFIVEEVARTLVGSLGLILATPITSAVAAFISTPGRVAVTDPEA